MSHTTVPNSDQNPKITSITQSSSPISSQMNSRNIKINPNSVQLPEEIWFLIFCKLYTIHIIENVQKVCKLFRKICIQPSMFRVINMTLPCSYENLNFDVNKMTRYAVDRSDGELVDVYVEYCCDDNTLMYICERSKKLKHLRIGHYPYISRAGLFNAMQRCPLKEVELTLCKTPYGTLEVVGSICRSLKSFSLNQVGSRYDRCCSNLHALEIAKNMPNLRHLQLIGNRMTNDGLIAILDGCPLLESLDIRACFRSIYGALRDRCESLKYFRDPEDSTADCDYTACTEKEINYHVIDEDYLLGHHVSDSDSDGDYDLYPEHLGYPKVNPLSFEYEAAYLDYLDDRFGIPYESSNDGSESESD